MPFCQKCGNKLEDGMAFCSKCGTATEWAGTANKPEEYAKREQVFVGKIKKCPQCGCSLSSEAVVCPECGHELGVNTISKELTEFKDSISKLETHALTSEKVAILLKSTITNFSVPHTKGDLRDLLVFVSGKVKNETTNIEWLAIWNAKLKQIVDEVSLLFANDKDFLDPFLKQKQECDAIFFERQRSEKNIMTKIKKVKLGKKGIIGIVCCILFLPMFIKSCNEAFRQIEAEANAKINAQTKEIQDKGRGAQEDGASEKDDVENYEKKEFKSVKIGKQVWAAENLAVKTDESGCYENKIENCKKYGRLYSWKSARKACPEGWTLPTMDDIRSLTSYMMEKGSSQESLGTDLKSSDGWNKNKGTPKGNNKYKFNALPSGKCDIFHDYSKNLGLCTLLEDVALFWTATSIDDMRAAGVRLDYDKTIFNGDVHFKDHLLAVRCIKE